MAETQSTDVEMTNSEFWSPIVNQVLQWFETSLASKDTLIGIIFIVTAAALAWPIATYFKKLIHAKSQTHTQNTLLDRLWHTASRLTFPLVWLLIQWLAEVVIDWLGYLNGTIVIVSSLLSAWIVINIAAVFVANPLGSKFIAMTAWMVAALNIMGLLDSTIELLRKTAISLGQVSISLLAIIQGVAALAVLLWATALAGQLIEGRLKRSQHLTPSLQVLSAKLLRIGLAILAFVFALSIVGIDLTAFAVFGGAIGVGLGFGLQKIFANLISGFILLVDKSIKPGDVITVGEDYGTVDSLGARYVSVLTRDGIEHLIPNEELITTKVENWSHSNSLLRLRKMVGVHYKSDVKKAMALCMESMQEIERILKDPAPNCLLRDFGDNSVNIEMRYWINDPMNGNANVTSELLLRVWDKFHENDIEIPYPQRDLHLRSSSIDHEAHLTDSNRADDNQST